MKKLIRKYTAVFLLTAILLSAASARAFAYTYLTLNKTSVSLKVSQSFKLEARLDTDKTRLGLVWQSDNEAVAKVDKEGNVTALSPGEANITVSVVEEPDMSENPDIVIIELGEPDDLIRAVCKVTVEKTGVESISLDRDTLNLRYKSSASLKPALTPETADNKAVLWSSSNAKIAAVDGSGRVTGTGKGTAVITAETVDGGYKAVCRVTVSYSVWQWLIVIFLGGWIWY